MEYGKLVEQGRHEELLEKQGIYASLWRVQSGIK
jgi:ATP-binding cassette subfamily B protein